jgi:hypothetical protein
VPVVFALGLMIFSSLCFITIILYSALSSAQ